MNHVDHDKRPYWTRLAVLLPVASLVVMAATGTAPVGAANVSSVGEIGLRATSIVDSSEPEPASADSTNEPAIDAEIARQTPVILARVQLEQAALSSGVDGLAVINADHDAGRLDLYWKGEVPESLRAEIDRVRERFTVVVHDAPYTWNEVAAEARRVLAEVKRLDGIGEVVVATAAEHDMSGVRVLVSQTPPTLAAAITHIDSHMPVRFEITQIRVPQLAPTGWRWDDLPPWTGGAVIERPVLFGLDVVRCSTAFTARTADNTIRGVFSAKHCGTNASWRTAVSHGPIGTSNLWFSDIDVMGIFWPTDSPAYLGFEGRVFSGVYNGSARIGVAASSWSGLNDIVCTSGGYTGSNCRQRVIDRNLFFEDPFGGPLFATLQMDGLAAVGQGDSGGPVYAAGLSNTIAHGVISAIQTGPGRATECMGWVPDGRQCSDLALHAELQPVLNTLGMQVIQPSESDSAPTLAPGAFGQSSSGQRNPELSGEVRLTPANGNNAR